MSDTSGEFGTARHKPFVRKLSLLDKIKAWPFDFLLWANELRLSIDWDDYCYSVALPSGAIVTGLYSVVVQIVNYYSILDERRENLVFQTDFHNYERIKRRAIRGGDPITPPAAPVSSPIGSGYWISLLKLFLFVVFSSSVINFISVFGLSFKKYSLMNATTPPKSPSVVNQFLNNANENDHSIFTIISRFFYNHTNEAQQETDYEGESFYDEETLDEENLVEKNIYQLNVWNPSKFPLFLSTCFSPITLFTVNLLAHEVSYWKLLIVIAISSFSHYFVITQRFLVLLNDKQILFQEMFQEYNDKFVTPKINILKKDVVIDATYGPTVPTEFVVSQDQKAHLLTEKLKVFITHDINGKAFNNISIKKINSRTSTPRQLSRATSPFRDNESTFRYSQFNDSHMDTTSDYNTSVRIHDELLRRVKRLEAQLAQEKSQLHKENLYPHQDSFRSNRLPLRSSTSVYDEDRKWNNRSGGYSNDYLRSQREPILPLYLQQRKQPPQSPSRYDRLDTFHKPDLSPSKQTPYNSRVYSSRSPSPHKDIRPSSPSFRSPSPQKIYHGVSSPSPSRSLSPSRNSPTRVPQSPISRRSSIDSRRPFR